MLTVQEFRALYGEETQCGNSWASSVGHRGFGAPAVCMNVLSAVTNARSLPERSSTRHAPPLPSRFRAIYRMSYDKKDISTMQLSKEISVSYPTAWLMQHKIRKAM